MYCNMWECGVVMNKAIQKAKKILYNNFDKSLWMINIMCVVAACIGYNIYGTTEVEGKWAEIVFLIAWLVIIAVFWYQSKVATKEKRWEKYCRKKFKDRKESFKYKNGMLFSVKLIFCGLVLLAIVYFLFKNTGIMKIAVKAFDTVQKIEIGNIIAIIAGAYAIILAFYPVAKGSMEHQCMVLDFEEIGIVKCFKWCFAGSVIIIIIDIIYLFVGEYSCKREKNTAIEGMTFVIWIIIMIFEIIILTIIEFNGKKLERGALKNIDETYWNKKIYIIPNKIWYKSEMLLVLQRFFDEYIKCVQKVNLNKIVDMDFGNIYEDKKQNYMICKSYFIGLLLMILIIMGCIGGERKFIFVLVNIPLFYVLGGKTCNINACRMFNTMIISQWGYYVKKTPNSIEYISSHDSIHKNKLRKLKRVICFYNLSLYMQYHDASRKNIEKESLNMMMDYLFEKQNKRNMGAMILPVLVCACLGEDNDKKVDKRLRRYINEIKMTPQQKKLIGKSSLLLIRDLIGDDDKYMKEQHIYKKRIKIYVML